MTWAFFGFWSFFRAESYSSVWRYQTQFSYPRTSRRTSWLLLSFGTYGSWKYVEGGVHRMSWQFQRSVGNDSKEDVLGLCSWTNRSHLHACSDRAQGDDALTMAMAMTTAIAYRPSALCWAGVSAWCVSSCCPTSLEGRCCYDSCFTNRWMAYVFKATQVCSYLAPTM